MKVITDKGYLLLILTQNIEVMDVETLESVNGGEWIHVSCYLTYFPTDPIQITYFFPSSS